MPYLATPRFISLLTLSLIIPTAVYSFPAAVSSHAQPSKTRCTPRKTVEIAAAPALMLTYRVKAAPSPAVPSSPAPSQDGRAHSTALATQPPALPAPEPWLAQLIQAEAGNQPFMTQLAVGAVAMNRLHSSQFPHAWWNMLHQRGQFETVSNGTWATALPRASALRAASEAETGWDPTDGALYFYNASLPHAAWMNTLIGCQTIGSMTFCHTAPLP